MTTNIDQQPPVKNIIGREPSWLVQSGIGIIFFTILSSLILTAFIDYPDIVYAPIIITSNQPPLRVVSKVNGRIDKLLVQDGDSVVEGQSLVIMESSVDYKQLSRLEKLLLSYSGQNWRHTVVNRQRLKGLGELQIPYSEFESTLSQLNELSNNEEINIREENNANLKIQYKILQKILRRKKSLLKEKQAFEIKKLADRQELVLQGLLADSELNQQRDMILSRRLTLNDLDIALEEYNLRISQLTRELTEFKVQQEVRIANLIIEINDRYLRLQGMIKQWRHLYVISAPHKSLVSMTRFLNLNDNVKIGEELFSLFNKAPVAVGLMKVNIVGSGKIKPRQSVEISIDSYPSQHFGFVKGTVDSIALLPNKNSYLVRVALENNLETSFGNIIPTTPKIQGSAKIVTKKISLMSRLFIKLQYHLEKIRSSE